MHWETFFLSVDWWNTEIQIWIRIKKKSSWSWWRIFLNRSSCCFLKPHFYRFQEKSENLLCTNITKICENPTLTNQHHYQLMEHERKKKVSLQYTQFYPMEPESNGRKRKNKPAPIIEQKMRWCQIFANGNWKYALQIAKVFWISVNLEK